MHARLDELTETLAAIPGVVAVALGGSRAQGTHTEASDWDFGLYYREGIDVDAVRSLGLSGDVFEPGDWGPVMNGGAWLTVDGTRVDLIYRDLAVVEHWIDEAAHGRFEVRLLHGFVAGIPTYVLAGEVAIGRRLRGELPEVTYPEALKATAPRWWRDLRSFSLDVAGHHARRADAVGCGGLLAKAAIAEAHARLAERGLWVLNEKGIVARASLPEAGAILAAPGSTTQDLSDSVARMRALVAGPHREPTVG